MIYLSFDQDWAPDWATRALLDPLVEAGLGGTLFVTHACPTLAELREIPGIELGWHPNFLPGSSQGATPAEVLATMRTLVPDAKGVRSHCLARSTRDWETYAGLGLRYDASDLLDGVAGIRPLPLWNGLVRLPAWFLDDVHLRWGRPLDLDALALGEPGMKVLAFHPILVALNAASLRGYEALKQALSARGAPMSAATEVEVLSFRDPGPGIGDLFAALIASLQDRPERCGGALVHALEGEP